MTVYKLVKDIQSNVKIYKNGSEISFYKHIVDLGIEKNGWGGYMGDPDQIAFAISYDIYQDKSKALETYKNFSQAISMAAPLELELSINAIKSTLERNVNDS
jgi:hypothetical protein